MGRRAAAPHRRGGGVRLKTFRAVLTCTVCGHTILTGPWIAGVGTAGDREMAAYNLDHAPAITTNSVREHLTRAGHATTVTFETGHNPPATTAEEAADSAGVPPT